MGSTEMGTRGRGWWGRGTEGLGEDRVERNGKV